MENENKDVKAPKSDESSKVMMENTLKDISTRLGVLEALLGSITKKEEKKEVKNEKLRY